MLSEAKHRVPECRGGWNAIPRFARNDTVLVLLALLCTPAFANTLAAPPAPRTQAPAEAAAKSTGCESCHVTTDRKTMHASSAVVLGCTDCHGGDARVIRPKDAGANSPAYGDALRAAHVLPMHPERWPGSRNPESSYAQLNDESAEFVRFINPGDLRVARESCGACHESIVAANERSLMSTGAMLFGGASYNNGILPFKRYVLGEAYTRDGEPGMLKGPVQPDANMKKKGILPALWPLPAWEITPPADVFRVFERGGRNINTIFPETGLPGVAGAQQRLEEPGRPDLKQSNRGPGTGNRIAVPLLNIHKTRLNDPLLSFLGTNDQPGDYRSSGCTACHVVYANDRDPRHSGPYAKFGHTGQTITTDTTIPRDEEGHPLQHQFTRAIPTSQCMVCHMHQPNIFLNSMLGYTMWDYESDAPAMWPKAQKYPGAEEIRDINRRNPEEAAIRGNWGERDFLDKVSELNPKLKDTQFADYHGHGWNFRAVFKRDRKGNLLDAAGAIVRDDDPQKFGAPGKPPKAVHLASIHVDKGMHCIDCHFGQDNHGNGHLYGEVAQAIEIDCQDCHGTADRYPSLRTSGPAAPPGGSDLGKLRTSDGRLRFEWINGQLWQRSALDPKLSWKMSLVKDTVTPGHREYNAKAARAKLMSRNVKSQAFGRQVAPADRAHQDDEMLCATCHTSWTTSCFGCHLPIQANWKSERQHFEGGETRNFATYNPQVVRDDFYMLGKHGEAKGFRIAPVRSTSALVLSSTNTNRERIYVQQPPIAASGFSSQAFAPHYPHTERKTETKTCTDCHLSARNDNNAWLASLLGQGTDFVDFVGFNVYAGGARGIAAIQVTEWDEPQAVIGSYLHRHAYPDWFARHELAGRELAVDKLHGTAGVAGCLQLRGEYLFVAEGSGGLSVYDVASIANKGVSQPLISAPFSPLGHDTRVASRNATCVVLPTNQPIDPARNALPIMRAENQEQAFRPIYHYALVTDAVEGLILVDVDTLADGEPRNNLLSRALTFNPGSVLAGARHATLAGDFAYIAADAGLVVVNLANPLKPVAEAVVKLPGVRASQVQFRYAFVTTDYGLQVLDVTKPARPQILSGARIALKDAHKLHVARTYAYVAAGAEGLAIIDVENPAQPKLVQRFDAGGKLKDARDVMVGSTNASLFAYVADAQTGLSVIQLTAPDTQPKFYGFSPAPTPQWIAGRPGGLLSLSRGLERDRAVDETGGQVAVFGRIGSRPFTLPEMQKLYLGRDGNTWVVSDR
ncbi:MAG TPA: hypothetical protein VM240_02140 [Verrucomicrobiae bacterium]|nr:hypothetical protein [Verrucomicrobiae bacterium]